MSTSKVNGVSGWGARWTRTTIRTLWFGIIPALLALASYRYGVPGPQSGYVGALATWSELCNARPTLALLGLFVLYVGLLRYWGGHLYGAALWLRADEQKAEAATWRQIAVWGASLVLAAVLALGVRESLYQPYRVLSASMLPTLAPGQELLANRHAYGFHLPFTPASKPQMPKRGDVIAFHKDLGPGMPNELVKRVVGLPGDSIVVRAGQLWINGRAVPACDAGRYSYLSGSGMLDARLVVEFLGDATYLTAFYAAPDYGQQPYVVQPGEVFVLGDNRSNSADSRFWNEGRGGGLPISEIGGRFERRLLGVAREGGADFSDFLRPIGLDVKLQGMDTTDLQQGIEACLRRRPKNTEPPPPFAKQGAQP
jgi:signal peptidase I